jgi:hypothetical protein
MGPIKDEKMGLWNWCGTLPLPPAQELTVLEVQIRSNPDPGPDLTWCLLYTALSNTFFPTILEKEH